MLRHADSFAGLRQTLAATGLPASAVILAGLIERSRTLGYAFQAVVTGIAMVRAGQIS